MQPLFTSMISCPANSSAARRRYLGISPQAPVSPEPRTPVPHVFVGSEMAPTETAPQKLPGCHNSHLWWGNEPGARAVKRSEKWDQPPPLVLWFRPAEEWETEPRSLAGSPWSSLPNALRRHKVPASSPRCQRSQRQAAAPTVSALFLTQVPSRASRKPARWAQAKYGSIPAHEPFSQGWSQLAPHEVKGSVHTQDREGAPGRAEEHFYWEAGRVPTPLCTPENLSMTGTFLLYNWSQQHVAFSEVLPAFTVACRPSPHAKWLECASNNATAPQTHLDRSCLSRRTHVHKPHSIPFPVPLLSPISLNVTEASLLQCWAPLRICMGEEALLHPW